VWKPNASAAVQHVIRLPPFGSCQKVEDAFTAIGYNQVWGEVAVILGGIPEQLAILLVAAQTLGESTLLRSSNEDTTMKNNAYPAYLRENHLENNQSSAEEKTTDVHPWDLQNYRVFSPGIQRHHRNLAWKSAQNVCHFLRVTSCQQATTITEWLSNKQKIHVLFELTCPTVLDNAWLSWVLLHFTIAPLHQSGNRKARPS